MFLLNSTSSQPSDVLIEAHPCCDTTMALSDIFPIFIVAGALWILVYCILMTQKIFMDGHYQEIQPKQHGDEEEEHRHEQQHNNEHHVESDK